MTNKSFFVLALVSVLLTARAEVPDELKPLSDSFVLAQNSLDKLNVISTLVSKEVKAALEDLIKHLKDDLLPKLKKIKITKWVIPPPGAKRIENKKAKNRMKEFFMAVNNFVKGFTKFGAETQAFMTTDLNGQDSNKWLFMALKVETRKFSETMNEISKFHRGKWQKSFLKIQDAITQYLVDNFAKQRGIQME